MEGREDRPCSQKQGGLYFFVYSKVAVVSAMHRRKLSTENFLADPALPVITYCTYIFKFACHGRHRSNAFGPNELSENNEQTGGMDGVEMASFGVSWAISSMKTYGDRTKNEEISNERRLSLRDTRRKHCACIESCR